MNVLLADFHLEFDPISCSKESSVRQPEERAKNVYIPVASEP